MSTSGVGMPAALLLQQFGQLVADAFDAIPYQVGSSLTTTAWRDVDVRLILDDERYAVDGYGDPSAAHSNAKWVAMTLAFSALGKETTGLPIDFQIQQQTYANKTFASVPGERFRSALFCHARMAELRETHPPSTGDGTMTTDENPPLSRDDARDALNRRHNAEMVVHAATYDDAIGIAVNKYAVRQARCALALAIVGAHIDSLNTLTTRGEVQRLYAETLASLYQQERDA